MFAYLVTAEFAKPPRNRGEILVFQRGKMPDKISEQHEKGSLGRSGNVTDSDRQSDTVSSSEETGITAGTSIFHWEDLCYDIKIKKQGRRLLDRVDGWVKPGKITALMV